MKKADILSGAGFGVLALWLLVYGIPNFTEGGLGYGLTPAQLPNAMAVAILVLSVIQVGVNLKKKTSEKGDEQQNGPGVAWAAHGVFWLQAGGLFGLFLLGLMFIGFIPAGIVFLSILQYFAGQRNYVTLTILAVVVPLFLYTAFRYGLGIFLPAGLLFG